MKEKILLLEDDQDINALLTLHLEKEGYEVISTFDGQQALDCFDHSIHLVVLDIMVPVLDGFDVLKRIREASTVPVLFLTSRTSETDKLTALGIGADDYITKPFTVMEVIYRIKAHIRRSYQYNQNAAHPSALLTHKDIEMNLDTKSVTVANHDIVLSAKEFELLQYFIENPGRVFTKQQLYEHVWGDAFYEDDNTIMVHISRLREKLGDDKKNAKYLSTIKGLGYRMVQT